MVMSIETKLREINVQNPLFINVKLLWFVGLWPTSDKSWLYVVYTMTNISIILTNMMTQFLRICAFWGDIKAVTETSLILISASNAVYKLVHILYNHSAVQRLVNRLDEELTEDCNTYCTDVLEKISRKSKSLTKLFCFAVSATSLFWIVLPVIMPRDENYPGRPLPLKAWFPFDSNVSPYYQFAYIFQVFYALAIVQSYTYLIAFYISLVIHTCGRFEVLYKLLELVMEIGLKDIEKRREDEKHSKAVSVNKHRNIQDEVSVSEKRRSSKKHFDEKREYSGIVVDCIVNAKMNNHLNKCVQLHSDILKYVNDLDSIFSSVMAIEFFIMLTITALVGFQIIVNPTDISEVLKFASVLWISIFELLLYCWYGNEIIIQSQSIQDVAYACQWYSSDKAFERGVQMIILSAQQPITIRAGKIYPISLSTFTLIMQNSYSILALLRQLHQSNTEEAS